METLKTQRAIIYTRVSTREQVDEGNSLVTQERACREYAFKKGFLLLEVFTEEGESAKTTERTSLLKLLSYCQNKKNQVDAIIVYKLDRIARNFDDYSYLRIQFKRFGIQICSASEQFTNDPAGKLMENTLASIAQFDNDVRAERCTNGMKEAVREGRYVWSAPVGYKNCKVGGKPNLAYSDNWHLVKYAFESVAKNNSSIEDVRRDVTKLGLKTKSNKPVSRPYFYRMLKNELYSGWIIKFQERHKGTFDPIISDITFNQVQRVLQNRKRPNKHYSMENDDFPLRRIIYLETETLTGSWAKGRFKKYPYYRFKQSKIYFRKDFLEQQFIDFFQKYRLDEHLLNRLAIKLDENLDQKTAFHERKITEWAEEISNLKKRQKQLIEKNLQGVISDAILKEHITEIEDQIFQIYSNMQDGPKTSSNFVRLLQDSLEFLKNPGKVWANSSGNKKRRLQRFVFPKGIQFEKNELRTTEICRIFKPKSDFLFGLSTLVDSEKNKTNTYKTISFEKDLYWQPIGEELETLSAILNSQINIDN